MPNRTWQKVLGNIEFFLEMKYVECDYDQCNYKGGLAIEKGQNTRMCPTCNIGTCHVKEVPEIETL